MTNRRSGTRPVWIAGIAAAALLLGIGWYLAPLDPNILALQFAFTPRVFGGIVHAWPAEHLLRYRTHLPIDVLLLLCYAAFGYLLETRTALFSHLPAVARAWARWALPAAALFDAVENGLHWWLTAAPRFGAPMPYAISASFAAIKWLLLFAFALTVVYALATDES